MLGRRGRDKMADSSIKILAITQKSPRSVRLKLLLGNERGTYDVAIVDQNGIFGIELPDTLGLKLRKFSPAESRNLVSRVRQRLSRNLVHV